ncbi:MAG: DUF1559 domain-containing protein [Planctomycetes bacterium]|nr:DUF1559 domain-containing protein [Planctomycetota bacterium]
MRRNVFVLATLISIAALLLPPVLEAQSRRASRIKCANNLRQIGLAIVQYGDDKRYLPHVKPTRELDGGIESNHSAVKIRALIFYGYHDNPEGFVCPSSDDSALVVSDEEVRDNMRKWHWGRATNPNPRTAPWLDSASDPKGSESRELSYGLTRRGYNRNVSSTKMISADRAVRDGTSKGALAGNHDEGWNVVQADCTVEWSKHDSESAKRLISTERGGGFLALKDQTDASKFKPLSKAPPAARDFAGWYKDSDGSLLKVRATEWSRRSKTWGVRGLVTIEGKTHPLVGRTVSDGFAGRVEGPSGLVEFKARAEGTNISIKIGERALTLTRTEAPAPPVDRQIAELVAVGLLAALKTRNRAAARNFMTPKARERVSDAELTKLITKVSAHEGRELGPYISQFQKLVVLCKDGTPRVDLGGAPDKSGQGKAREAAAIGSLKAIVNAQTLFREGDKDRNNVLDYADTLSALGKVQLIDSVLASGEKQGYRFEVCRGSKSPQFVWMAVATPVDPKAGLRSFAVNQSSMIVEKTTPFKLDDVKCEPKGGKPLRR